MNANLSFEERLARLDDIKETLMDERKFYMSRRDWPRVTVTNRCLKQHKEQVARVIHMMSKTKTA